MQSRRENYKSIIGTVLPFYRLSLKGAGVETQKSLKFYILYRKVGINQLSILNREYFNFLFLYYVLFKFVFYHENY